MTHSLTHSLDTHSLTHVLRYLSAHYDNRADRFVAGAQDNSAQVFAPHAGPDAVAVGFVGGDGTVTLVDNVHNPSRLYGTAASTPIWTFPHVLLLLRAAQPPTPAPT